MSSEYPAEGRVLISKSTVDACSDYTLETHGVYIVVEVSADYRFIYIEDYRNSVLCFSRSAIKLAFALLGKW